MKMTMGERAAEETKYITWFLLHNPEYKRNGPGRLPDITKPDGKYLEIKAVDPKRRLGNNYNYVFQCHGFYGNFEIDNWYEMNMLKDIEYKFICQDRIVLIRADELWDLISEYHPNRETTYEQKHPHATRKVGFTDESSTRTAYYFVKREVINNNSKSISFETYQRCGCVFKYIKHSKDLWEMM